MEKRARRTASSPFLPTVEWRVGRGTKRTRESQEVEEVGMEEDDNGEEKEVERKGRERDMLIERSERGGERRKRVERTRKT